MPEASEGGVVTQLVPPVGTWRVIIYWLSPKVVAPAAQVINIDSESQVSAPLPKSSLNKILGVVPVAEAGV